MPAFRRLTELLPACRRCTVGRLFQSLWLSSRFVCHSPPHYGSFKYRHNRTTPEDAVNPLTTPTNIDAGVLHVVSVPIGNLKDFSIRALDVLRQVDYIITTDRPATKTLLDLVHIESQGRLIHYSRTNRTATKDKLVELLLGGRRMAFVCTSGTPCVGDVGSELVRCMQAEGVRVAAVPGPCALTSALAVAGVTASPFEACDSENNSRGGAKPLPKLATLREGSFFFGNMLPESHGERLRILRTTVGEGNFPCVFYEVPRRLLTVLQDIAIVLPRRRVLLMHELTKMNESIHADLAEKLIAFYSRQEAHSLLKKGQLVLIIDGPGEGEIHERLQREVRKRQKLRLNVSSLTRSSDSIKNEEVQTPPSPSQPKKSRRLLLQRRQRERLIRKIEREQERIRMAMAINRNDASKH
ncbi:putative Tetrapyrrole (Corrin Porphyrin) Methylase [Trypanosoma vivax]|nr:16S rRNA (cytidine1402-2-O)-methyltransferase [Trypanosoma vivax]KAH8604145.1 putative Tetrapyrrole (Corrin Porphyrin) Methylase [Trypanosoma vivax]